MAKPQISSAIYDAETLKLVSEIISLAPQATTEQVMQYAFSYGMSLSKIKRLLLNGELVFCENDVFKTDYEAVINNSFSLLSSISFDFTLETTWSDKLSRVMHNTGYNSVYLLLLLAYHFWRGVVDAKEDVWE